MTSSPIGKTVAVLEALGECDFEASLAEITAIAGMPKTTTHRVLQELAQHRFVVADGHGRYYIGPGFLSLAGKVLGQKHIGRQARVFVKELCDATGQAVHLAVRNGNNAIYIDKRDPPQPYQMASRVGMSIPLHCTSIGKAILAALPPDEAENLLLSTDLEQRTTRTLSSLPELREELAAIRQRGFAIDNEENEEGVRCVGAAVYGSVGDVIGAVSISALSFSLTDERVAGVAAEVMNAAAGISEALGYPAARQVPGTPRSGTGSE
jgi:IclR family transcriptional regulator, acetate operon repressor